jgi:P-type conjugative transfer protein TrbJ
MQRSHLIGAALALALLAPGMAHAQFGGIVTDIVAEAQTTETAIQTTASVAKQIQQYQTQVLQYQNMVQNTVAPVTNLYRQTTADISGAQNLLDGVTRLVPAGQSVTQYLSQFTGGGGLTASTDFCATGGLCAPQQFAAAQAAQGAAAQARDAALVAGSQTQLASLQSQATDLQSIGQASQGATGQMQALGYSNQIAAINAAASLQIASKLTQQTAQEAADRLAAQQAAAKESAAMAADSQTALSNMTTFYGPAPTGTYGQMAAGLPTLSQ